MMWQWNIGESLVISQTNKMRGDETEMERKGQTQSALYALAFPSRCPDESAPALIFHPFLLFFSFFTSPLIIVSYSWTILLNFVSLMLNVEYVMTNDVLLVVWFEMGFFYRWVLHYLFGNWNVEIDSWGSL